MANHLDKYRRRMSRNGNDVGEVYKNNTIAFIEATFHASPTFRVMEVNSFNNPEITEMDARVVEIERLGSLREVILRPTQSLEIGTYVKFDGDTWLLFDKYGGTGATSIKMLAIRCNDTMKWQDKNGNIIELPCNASASDLGSKSKQSKNEIEWNKYDVRLPLGQLFISVELNEQTKYIDLNQRFIFGRNAYEVTGIDDISLVDSGYGIIQLTVKITTKRDEDDFANELAFNKYTVEEEVVEETTTMTMMKTVSTTSEEEEDNKGGRIW
jgi:hypothetical protein